MSQLLKDLEHVLYKSKKNAEIKKHRLEDPEYCRKAVAYREYANVRRLRKLSNGVFNISIKELKRLYSSPCIYCGSNNSIQADHVIPISKGGVHSIGNLVPACSRCNQSKSNKFLSQWKRDNKNVFIR